MQNQTEEAIQEAINQGLAGNKPRAKQLLSQVVRQEPGNARAWYLLSQVVEKNEQAIYCLEQVLKVQPDNPKAKERLELLQSGQTQTVKPEATPRPEATTPKKKLSKGSIIALVLLGAIGLCVVCGGGLLGLGMVSTSPTRTALSGFATVEAPSSTPIRATDTSQPLPTAIPTDAPILADTPEPLVTTPPTSKLGETVTGYGYSLSGIDVNDPVTENGVEFCQVKPNERILAVQIVLENITGDAIYTVNPLNFSLVDNEGFVYVSALCNVDGVEGLKDIQPGQKDRRWITFIVPIGSTAASVQWNIDSFGDRYLMAGLIPSRTGTTPQNVVDAFKSAGLEAENARPMTKDDYGLVPMADEGIRFFIPSLGADSGGRIMRYSETKYRDITTQIYNEAGKSNAVFFSWVFVCENIVVQINGDLPEEKARQYEKALSSICK